MRLSLQELARRCSTAAEHEKAFHQAARVCMVLEHCRGMQALQLHTGRSTQLMTGAC